MSKLTKASVKLESELYHEVKNHEENFSKAVRNALRREYQ